MRTLASQFGPALQGHLSLAFEELRLQGPGWPAPGPQRGLLQVALQSQQDRSPWRRLLGEALERRCPLLAVLAACAQVRGLGLAPPSTTYWEVRSTLTGTGRLGPLDWDWEVRSTLTGTGRLGPPDWYWEVRTT